MRSQFHSFRVTLAMLRFVNEDLFVIHESFLQSLAAYPGCSLWEDM